MKRGFNTMRQSILTPVLLLALAACGTTETITRDRIVRDAVPVPQPCAGPRPAPVTPLRAKYPGWHTDLDVKQKASAVGAQGLERQTHAEQLAAATGACP